MRHQTVRRATLLLALLMLLLAWVFVWLVRDQAPTPLPAAHADPGGAALFEQHCTPCHSAADLRRELRDDDTRAAWEVLLENHGTAADHEDRVILDFLGA